MSTQEQILFTLNDCGVFSMSPTKQDQIATKLLEDGFSAADIARLYEFSKRSSRTSFDRSASLARLLQEDKRDILRALASASKFTVDPDDKKFGDPTLGSHIRNCSETNPYGWDKPKLTQGEDHDRPDEWNPFRQCYNLTEGERAKLKASDHRRRGCSRYECLGTKTKQVPSLSWSQDDWNRAMQFSSGSEPITTIGGEQKVEDRDIYGV